MVIFSKGPNTLAVFVVFFLATYFIIIFAFLKKQAGLDAAAFFIAPCFIALLSMSSYNKISTPASRFFYNVYYEVVQFKNRNDIQSSNLEVASISREVFNKISGHDVVIFVLLESWYENSSDLVDFVNSIDRSSITNISFGHRYFKGSTLQAEIRELCSLSDHNIDVRSIGGPDCFNRLDEFKFKSAYHGYYSSFYRRADIWTYLGFDNMIFKDNRHSKNLCSSAFDAICDYQLIDDLLGNIKNNSFNYFVSIDAHEPVLYDGLEKMYRLNADYYSIYRDNVKSINRANIKYMINKIKAMEGNELIAQKKFLIYFFGDHIPPSKAGIDLNSSVPWLLMEMNFRN